MKFEFLNSFRFDNKLQFKYNSFNFVKLTSCNTFISDIPLSVKANIFNSLKFKFLKSSRFDNSLLLKSNCFKFFKFDFSNPIIFDILL